MFMALDPLTLALLAVFLLIAFLAYALGKKLGRLQAEKDLERRIPEEREEAIKRSRAVLSGQFSEQLAPYLPDFPYKPTEARFIGKPVDFIVFKGMDERNISEVVFVEVKTGASQLSSPERRLKETIEGKNVRWERYTFSGRKK